MVESSHENLSGGIASEALRMGESIEKGIKGILLTEHEA